MIKKLLVLTAFVLSLGLIGCAPPPGPGPQGPGPGPQGGPMGQPPAGQYGGPMGQQGGPNQIPPVPLTEPQPNTIYQTTAP